MAIKITTDGFLKIEHPKNGRYSVHDMSASLKTDEDYIKFIDMGLFILVIDDAPERPMNSVGSLYFRFEVFGDLLIMSGQELPKNAPVLTTQNSNRSIDVLEAGIIQSVKEVLSTYKQVMSNDGTKTSTTQSTIPSDIPLNMEPSKEKRKKGKVIYHFDPEKEGDVDSNEEEFMKEFYEKAYEVIKNENNIDVSNLVLYEDYEVIIKFTPGKVKKTLMDMINHFSTTEDYEKCATIRDIANNISDITQKEVDDAVQE